VVEHDLDAVEARRAIERSVHPRVTRKRRVAPSGIDGLYRPLVALVAAGDLAGADGRCDREPREREGPDVQ
jgi:hypothetical protein